MSLLLSILNGIRTLKKIQRKSTDKKNIFNKKNIFKIILNSLYPIIIEAVLVVTIIAVAIYSVTGAIGELFNWFKKDYGLSSNPPSSYYQNLSEEKIKEILSKTGANLDPKKIPKYMEFESKSVPSTKNGIEITEKGENGKVTKTSSRNVTLDLSKFFEKYKVNWEFLAAIDIASFNANDIQAKNAINKADTLLSEFEWYENYSRDTTNTERVWKETYEYDTKTGKTTLTNNTYNSSKETFTTVKEPLAIPKKVTTMFGDFVYRVQEDVIIKNEPYSAPFVINEEVTSKEVFDRMVPDYTQPIYAEQDVYIVKTYGTNNYKEYKAPIDINTTFRTNRVYSYIGTHNDYYVYENGWWIFTTKLLIHKDDIPSDEVDQDLIFSRYDTESVFTGRYKEKAQYKTIIITTKTMKKTKQKIVEDKPYEPSLNFNPTKFIKYLNDNDLSVDDLDLVRETMTNIPNGNFLLDNIDRIAKGSYGDIGNGNTGGSPGNVLGGFSFSIPLFIQWDSRWGNQPYAGETIGVAGCAPTSMAMVITGLEGKMNGIDLNNDNIVDPSEAAKWSTKNGYAAYMQGTYDGFINAISREAGLSVEQTYSGDKAYNALKEGKVVVANVVSGTIINGYHFLVLTGVNHDGSIRMNDPYSKSNSEKSWALNTIKIESRNYWIIDNPNADIYDKNLTPQELFIAKIRRGAISTYHEFGILPSITIAQAIEESGWGKTSLATNYNNLFGIKADSSWNGPKVALTTGENYNDTIVTYFRVYNTWAESIYDHGLFLYQNSRYAQFGFFKANDYRGQAQALEDAGYATLKDSNGNPIYADHLIDIIEGSKLYEIDNQLKNLR